MKINYSVYFANGERKSQEVNIQNMTTSRQVV